MQDKSAVSLQIACLDTGVRLYVAVGEDAVALQGFAHHGVSLPMTRQTYLRGIFIVYTEQSGFQVEHDALAGEEAAKAAVQRQVFGSTDGDTVRLVHEPDFVGYLQSRPGKSQEFPAQALWLS